MGKIKSHLEDWLDDYGHNEGYSMGNTPRLSELSDIKRNNIDAQEYSQGSASYNKPTDNNKTHCTKTKTGKVLAHLQYKGSITSWEAIELFRATRLSAIIFNLRDEGYDIWSENCNCKETKTHWVNYIYKGVK